MDFAKDLKDNTTFSRDSFSVALGFLVNFLVPLVCLGGTAFLAAFIAIPAYNEVPSLESDLRVRETLATQLESKVTTLNRIMDSRDLVETYSSRIDQALISEPKVPELLSQVDHISRQSGMEVTSLNYSRGTRTVEEEGYRDVGVSLSSEGSFTSLVEFLRRIENASRLVLVDDLRYSLSRDGDDTSRVNVNFRIHSPYLSVASDAVTDDPIDLDIYSETFISDMERLLELDYYDVNELEPFYMDDPEEPVDPEDPESPFGRPAPVDPDDFDDDPEIPDGPYVPEPDYPEGPEMPSADPSRGGPVVD